MTTEDDDGGVDGDDDDGDDDGVDVVCVDQVSLDIIFIDIPDGACAYEHEQAISLKKETCLSSLVLVVQRAQNWKLEKLYVHQRNNLTW